MHSAFSIVLKPDHRIDDSNLDLWIHMNVNSVLELYFYKLWRKRTFEFFCVWRWLIRKDETEWIECINSSISFFVEKKRETVKTS